MSTITTINSTDLISDSRTTINTNFTNLNSGKVDGATNLTAGSVPYVSSSGTLNQDSQLTYDQANHILSARAIADASGNNSWALSGGALAFLFRSVASIGWSSTTSYAGTLDVGMSRDSAGVLQVNDGSFSANYRDLRLRNLITSPTTPANAAATGAIGTIVADANYIYVCTATNTWKRVAIATW